MRWIASLVVCCLVAAAGVRPAQAARELRDPCTANRSVAASLADAHGLAASVHVRRANPISSDARLPAFIVVTPVAFAPPARVVRLAPGSAPAPVVVAPRPSRSSRGPPVG